MQEILIVENLSKSYGNVQAVCDVSLRVVKGEIFGLIGANGAGKSTTIECILGTKKYDKGRVELLGMDPSKDRKKLFEKVGVQFQEGNYQDKITVKELCQLTESLYRETKDYLKLLEDFKLIDKLKSPVSSLSGGQKQRLFIILALIPKPKVVFFDELTTGLDTKARRDLWKYLSELKKEGLTIFLTSHYMDEVEVLCDRIAILKEGKIVFSGTPSEAVASGDFASFEDAYLYYAGEE